MENLNAQMMKAGFSRLNELLPKKIELTVGGGGAMLLAHNFPLATTDVDAIPRGMSQDELKPLIEKIAKEFSYPVDWLNPWFESFTHVLPQDYSARLIRVFNSENLKVFALGSEDLLIMKCFAHRRKDIAHARALVREGANLDFVMDHIELLKSKKIPSSEEALNFLDEIMDLENL
jgi:hypothetical protein